MQSQQYEYVAEISEEAYEEVFKAQNLKNEGCFVTLKKVKLQTSEKEIPRSIIQKMAILKYLKIFGHPSIVRLFDVYSKSHTV